MLQSVIDEQKSAPKNVLRIIETISKHNNTPRKKPKFINFVKNVCGAKTNPKDIDQAWDLISVKLSALSNANAANNKNNDTSEGNDNEEEANVDKDDDDDVKKTNGETKDHDEETVEENGIDLQNGDGKKMSKKQRKEEKKRRKYEAELQKAAEPHTETEEKENQPNKKDKKKKNKNVNGDADVDEDKTDDKNNKNKKRKRQDTVNGVAEAIENAVEPVVVETASKEKKKPKVIVDEVNDSICLHDQNVANSAEVEEKKEKFDWHAVIFSVLQKKGNELPFKRLQKKVLGEYSEATGREVDDRIAEKFIKKLKSAPKVHVDKNRVVLEE